MKTKIPCCFGIQEIQLIAENEKEMKFLRLLELGKIKIDRVKDAEHHPNDICTEKLTLVFSDKVSGDDF